MSEEQLEVILSERNKPMVRRGDTCTNTRRMDLKRRFGDVTNIMRQSVVLGFTQVKIRTIQYYSSSGEHNHDPDPLRCDVKVVLKKIQQVACTSKDFRLQIRFLVALAFIPPTMS
jgi:hypothetical protein